MYVLFCFVFSTNRPRCPVSWASAERTHLAPHNARRLSPTLSRPGPYTGTEWILYRRTDQPFRPTCETGCQPSPGISDSSSLEERGNKQDKMQAGRKQGSVVHLPRHYLNVRTSPGALVAQGSPAHQLDPSRSVGVGAVVGVLNPSSSPLRRLVLFRLALPLPCPTPPLR